MSRLKSIERESICAPLKMADRTEDSNTKLRRQMEQFFEATSDAVVFIDREWRFTFLNRRANELVAAGRQLTGANIFESFPEMLQEDSPFASNYRRTMEERVPTRFDAYYPAPLNMWFSVHSLPTDDGIVVFFRDVSDERSAREELQRKTEELQQQHAELTTIYDTAPIGLAYFDLNDYHYRRLNERQAAFFGLQPEQVVGKTLTEMAPIPGLRELFDQVARGEPVINYPLEGTLATDPGDYRYWSVSYFPVYAADGSIQGITAASQEITQQRKAEQALLQTEKLALVGRLASSIAHEINNPLEAVTNLLFLASQAQTLEQAQDFVRSAEVELRRAAAITQQTLRFHKQSTKPQMANVAEVIESVLSIYQSRITNAKIAVVPRWRTTRTVLCFEGEVRQVVTNLVSNALDAMQQGGTLCVRTRESTDWRTGRRGVAISVSDTGHGMSRETLAKLFHPFFTTKGETGTGLGLWVSKEIVERHRGTLRVRTSQHAQHHGTTFVLFVPFDCNPG